MLALYQHLHSFFQVPPSFGQHPLGLLHRTGREYLQEHIYSRQKFLLSSSGLWAQKLTVGCTSSSPTPRSFMAVLLHQYLILGVPSSNRRPGLFFELFRLPRGLWKNGHLTLDTETLWVQVHSKRQRGYQIYLGWGKDENSDARSPNSPLFLASLSCMESFCIMSPVTPLKGQIR